MGMNCSSHPGLKYPSLSKASSLIFTILAISASEIGSRRFSGIARAFSTEEEGPAKVISRPKGCGAFISERTGSSSHRKGGRGAFGEVAALGVEGSGPVKVPAGTTEGAKSTSFSFLFVLRLFKVPGLLLRQNGVT